MEKKSYFYRTVLRIPLNSLYPIVLLKFTFEVMTFTANFVRRNLERSFTANVYL